MKHQIHASIYEIEMMLMTVIMKNICNIQSMQGMSEKFNDESCEENLCRILGAERHEFLPHYVTVNEFLKKLDMGELETHERHCPHCLKKVLNKGTKEEKTIYYHHAPEAKLVLADSRYASEPVFERCIKDNKWHILIRYKDGSIPSIAEEYSSLAKTGAEELDKEIAREYPRKGRVLEKHHMEWVADIDYREYKLTLLVLKAEIECTKTGKTRMNLPK